jgi:hypothetical protein
VSSLDVTPEKKTRAVAIVLLLLTFVVGIGGGVVGDRLLLFRQHRLLPTHGLRFVSARVLHRLDRELNLNPQQRAQIGQILDKRQRNIEATWKSIQPQVRQQLEETDRDIERTLTPEQQKKFRVLRDRWRQHARGFFEER